MRASAVLNSIVAALAAVTANAQDTRAVPHDSAAVVRAMAASDSSQRAARAATNAAGRFFFVNIGADSVWERRVANALGYEFQVLPSGVTPRCHDDIAGDAPIGNRVAVRFAFASADSAQVLVTIACEGKAPSGARTLGSQVTYTVARRNSAWVVLSVRARVS